MTVDHMCFNTLCSNPRHLRVMSRSENSRRKEVSTRNVCNRGHDLLETGRLIGNGRRQCVECLKITGRAAYDRLVSGEYVPPRKTSCKRGHSEESMRQHPTGSWYCAECKRVTNQKPPKPKPEACRAGHPYAEHGTVDASGFRRCVTCHNARRRERYAAQHL